MTRPYDEPSINADDKIIRRIDPVQHVVWDDNRDCERISSKAFNPSSGQDGGMSVDIENLILAAGIDPRQFVTTPKFRGSVFFVARAARDLGLRIGHVPIEGDDQIPANPYHGEVWGPSDRPNRFTKSQGRKLQEAVQWYVNLPGVETG